MTSKSGTVLTALILCLSRALSEPLVTTGTDDAPILHVFGEKSGIKGLYQMSPSDDDFHFVGSSAVSPVLGVTSTCFSNEDKQLYTVMHGFSVDDLQG